MPSRARWSALVGGAVAVAIFWTVLTAWSFDLFAPGARAADFYDAQARSFLDGRWDIEPGILGIEAFEVDGREQTYFGVVPALMRVPVVAATDSLDGRLTRLSMTAALVVSMAAASSLSWAVRGLVRPGAALERPDLVVAAVVPVLVGSGSILLFLAGRAWVYHEAIAWAVAFTLLTARNVTVHLMTGRTVPLVVAAVAAVAALHTRASTGAGAVAMVALVGAAAVLAGRPDSPTRRGTRTGRRGALLADRVLLVPPPRVALPLAAACVSLAVVTYVGVNMARFGEPLRLPLELQTYVAISEERQEVLEANDGSLFGLQFVPTTALQYLRPDAVSLGRVYPFVGFPDGRATVVGDVRFDTLDPASSIPASMPALAVGAVVGMVLVGRAVARRDRLRVLAVPLVGGAAGAATCLTIGYVAHRYQGDALPFLIVASLPTLHAMWGLAGRWRPTLVAAAVALATWGVAANASLAVLYQRQEAPDVHDHLRARLLSSQLTVADRLPGARPPAARRVDQLPELAPRGDLVILDPCLGIYWGDGERWRGVMRTPATGGWDLDVEWPETDPGALHPLVGSGDSLTANVLVAEMVAPGRVRIGYVWDDEDGRRTDMGRTVAVDDSSRVEVVFDPVTVEIRVVVDQRVAFEGFRFLARPGDAVGRSAAGGSVQERFGGRLEIGQADRSLCGRLPTRGR
ncbi:MAG: hypothetical protein ACXIVQ_01335 [Acidimicrobiales bacterium]